jgi:hypothetical protein
MGDNAFDPKTFLRFILPGAVCGLAGVLALDMFIFLTSDSSFLRMIRHVSSAVGFTLALIPASFALGVVLNAFTFQRGYNWLAGVYAKYRPRTLKLEEHLYQFVLSRTATQYASRLDEEDGRSLEAVLWKNKRGAFMARFNSDILERLDDRYSPYADFQLGLAIALSLLCVVALPWLFTMDYHLLTHINPWATSAVLILFTGIMILTLLRGSYSNYAKLREMRLVMVISLAASEQDDSETR